MSFHEVVMTEGAIHQPALITSAGPTGHTGGETMNPIVKKILEAAIDAFEEYASTTPGRWDDILASIIRRALLDPKVIDEVHVALLAQGLVPTQGISVTEGAAREMVYGSRPK